MAAPSYIARRTGSPGSRVPPSQMRIIESMPVKSLVTFPQSGISHDFRQRLTVRGHAWAGDNQISGVFISIDFGATWLPLRLTLQPTDLPGKIGKPGCNFPNPVITKSGREPWTTEGKSQPMVVPGWNPRGYSITPVTAWRCRQSRLIREQNESRQESYYDARSLLRRQALTLLPDDGYGLSQRSGH